MGQYIDKAALIAEIERRIKTNKECMLGLRNLDYYQGKVDALKDTLSSLDTHEVKEIDLQKEIDRVWDNNSDNFSEDGWKEFEDVAKYFFEFGLRASNPLTWEDISIIREILCGMVGYPLITDKEVCIEVLKRFKAQKGE